MHAQLQMVSGRLTALSMHSPTCKIMMVTSFTRLLLLVARMNEKGILSIVNFTHVAVHFQHFLYPVPLFIKLVVYMVFIELFYVLFYMLFLNVQIFSRLQSWDSIWVERYQEVLNNRALAQLYKTMGIHTRTLILWT